MRLRPVRSVCLASDARRRIGVTMLALLAIVAHLGASGVPSARAEAPWWRLSSETGPTDLPPGGEGTVVVRASNLGAMPINSAVAPVVLATVLPSGLVPTQMVGSAKVRNSPSARLRP